MSRGKRCGPERSYNYPGPDLSSFVTIHLTSPIQQYINTYIHAPRPGMKAMEEGNGGALGMMLDIQSAE